MSSEELRQAEARAYLPPLYLPGYSKLGWVFDKDTIELSDELRADLLDFDAWGEILTTFGHTMRVAVALTDPQGHLLGTCYNAQPAWKLVHDAVAVRVDGCPFCITTDSPCTAVAQALQSEGAVIVHDQAGLAHMAVPLLLGKQPLGAIIAGQVFDRFPELLPLRRVAKNFGVPPQQLWEIAIKQRPVSGAVLKASGDLLCALGRAFLRQRYGAILEAQLAGTNSQFRLLVEEVRDYALFTMDPLGCVTSWNVGAERMLGYEKSEIMGHNFSCMFASDDIRDHVPETQLYQALQAGRTDDEGWRVRENRKQFWANVNITPMPEGAGMARGFIIIMQDVTERRKVAVVLAEARQERARLQQEFLSHVSHELRTPLTAIYLFTTNLLDGLLGDLTIRQHEHLAFAVDNVKQLSDMVSDLLDITRIETHKLTVECERASPVKLIAEALRSCHTNALGKSICLRSTTDPTLPFVWADPARVRQILINLIDNGIKFTPQNGTVSVDGQLSEEESGFLCIAVSDTGCGISAENRDRVFDRLAQVRSSTEASRSGLGLGLFIARELVSRHGGRIWVDCEMGHGSIFRFTLPVFSLAKLCARVLTAVNLELGFVTLIIVDVVAVEGPVGADILPQIRDVLKRCIQAGKDVLLPSMSDAEPAETFFILACTDPNGFKVIANRIASELRTFDTSSQFKPVISSTTLSVVPHKSTTEQIGAIAARLEHLVHSHLLSKERLK